MLWPLYHLHFNKANKYSFIFWHDRASHQIRTLSTLYLASVYVKEETPEL